MPFATACPADAKGSAKRLKGSSGRVEIHRFMGDSLVERTGIN
jgi:hypothetical protein